MKYVYPAIFTVEDNGIVVEFPTLEGCYTDGTTMEEAFENAEDVLNLTLMSMENHGEPIPRPLKVSELKVPNGATVSLIRADTLAYRKKVENKAVRKNISIPAWLNDIVVAKNISLSNFLQNALIRELGLQS